MLRSGLFPTLVLALLLVPSTSFSLITVEQDGSGDFTTLGAAIDASTPGETIVVGPGHYNELGRTVTHPMTIQSSDGAAVTTIDGGLTERILIFDGPSGVRVEGLTFTRGSGVGAAVVLKGGADGSLVDCVFTDCQGSAVATGTAQVTVERCTFRNNHSPTFAAGLYVSTSSVAHVVDSSFENNLADDGAAGISVVLSSQATVTRCRFTDNIGVLRHAAISVGNSTLDITDSFFRGNRAIGSTIYYTASSGNVTGNTFDDNGAPRFGFTQGTIYIESSNVAFTRNIVTNDDGGYGYQEAGNSGEHTCNLYFGNLNDGVAGDALDPTELIADPMYCNPPAGDYTISSEGPAAPANSACAQLIGAFDVGCGGPPLTGTVFHVEQDGSGDFTTVADAIDATTEGDTIIVGPGHYFEPERVVSHSLVMFSREGAAATTIDGNLTHRILQFLNAPSVRVEGLTFTRGFDPANGTAIAFRGGTVGTVVGCVFENCERPAVESGGAASLTIEQCTFRNNHTPTFAAGLYVTNGGFARVVESVFEHNHADDGAPAMSVVNGGRAELLNCRFDSNVSGVRNGAISVNVGSHLDVEGCLFTRNRSDIATALYYYQATGSVIGSTFDDNRADSFAHGSVVINESVVSFQRNIVTRDSHGAGLAVKQSSVSHMCNLYYGNAGGPVGLVPMDPSETEIWPMFCDIDNAVYTVSSDGPAVAANNPCGLDVGAFGAGCNGIIDPPGPPPPPPGAEPEIISILDVPNDDGRQVRIKWNASNRDVAGSSTPIVGYGIYRHDGMITPEQAIALLKQARTGNRGSMIDEWDFVASVPARGDGIYQTVVPTTCDSTKTDGLCSNAFFVSAMTEDPTVFWDSAPDTGYSVDNEEPNKPDKLRITYGHDKRARLDWDGSTSSDVEAYGIYRGISAGFETNPESRAGTTVDKFWIDPMSGSYFYKVTAIDDAGNESLPVLVDGMAEPVATTFALYQNVPNPFNPTTTIRYAVGPGGGQVALNIYDVRGRLVRRLVDRHQTTGEKNITWDGRNDLGERVSSGVYFYRLTAPSFVETRKMVLLQ